MASCPLPRSAVTRPTGRPAIPAVAHDRGPSHDARHRRVLEQIPVWTERARAVGASAGSRDEAPGLAALLGGLDREQLRAVTHGEGPLLVVAGAGTGKTQVVTRRIAWLIATRRARPSEILALTFTDKAAAEMQVRVDQLVPYGYTDTAISTFHAFGDRLIREYALELGLPPEVRVLSRSEVVIFLRERLFELDLERYRPLGDPTRFLGALAGALQPAQGRGHRPGRLPGPRRRGGRPGRAARRAARPRPTPRTTIATRPRRRPRRRPGSSSWPAPTPATRSSSAEAGCLDFGDQVATRAAPPARAAGRPPRGPAPLPVRPRGRVPGHEPGPGRRSWS